MRIWIVLLLVPLAGCFGDGADAVCEPLGPPRQGDAATYEVASRLKGGALTPTLRVSADPWLGTAGYLGPELLERATMRVAVDAAVAGTNITYTLGDAPPTAVEHVAADGALEGVTIWVDDVVFQRLDQGGMPYLMGAQWAWGQQEAAAWEVEVRYHGFRHGTNDTARVDVEWAPEGCGGALTATLAAPDDGPLLLAGFRTTFDDQALPLRFEILDQAGDAVRTSERVDVTAGAGSALVATAPARIPPLGLVTLGALKQQAPAGFSMSIAEAEDAIRGHPQGAAFFAQFPAAALHSFVHSPVGDGDWWGLQYHETGGGQLLDATVRSGPLGGVDVVTQGIGGDVFLFDAPIVSLEALSTWHADHAGGTMDSVWCDDILFGLCIFGSAEEVMAAYSDGATPGVIDGSGFTHGYRVNHATGLVADVKLA